MLFVGLTQALQVPWLRAPLVKWQSVQRHDINKHWIKYKIFLFQFSFILPWREPDFPKLVTGVPQVGCICPKNISCESFETCIYSYFLSPWSLDYSICAYNVRSTLVRLYMYSLYKYVFWGRSVKYFGMERATRKYLAYRVSPKLHNRAYDCPTWLPVFFSSLIPTSSCHRTLSPSPGVHWWRWMRNCSLPFKTQPFPNHLPDNTCCHQALDIFLAQHLKCFITPIYFQLVCLVWLWTPWDRCGDFFGLWISESPELANKNVRCPTNTFFSLSMSSRTYLLGT